MLCVCVCRVWCVRGHVCGVVWVCVCPRVCVVGVCYISCGVCVHVGWCLPV